jgi:hypothetical protein
MFCSSFIVSSAFKAGEEIDFMQRDHYVSRKLAKCSLLEMDTLDTRDGFAEASRIRSGARLAGLPKGTKNESAFISPKICCVTV